MNLVESSRVGPSGSKARGETTDYLFLFICLLSTAVGAVSARRRRRRGRRPRRHSHRRQSGTSRFVFAQRSLDLFSLAGHRAPGRLALTLPRAELVVWFSEPTSDLEPTKGDKSGSFSRLSS